MKRILVTLLLVSALVLTQAIPAFAATTADVTITATPEYLSITVSNSPNTWAIGAIAEATTVYWTADTLVPAEPLVDGDMKETITNAGSVTSDVTVECADFTGGAGWTLSADETPAADEVNLRAGITGMANLAAMIQVVNAPAELIDSLAALGTKMFCLILETGTFSDGDAKSGTLTLTIAKHV
jgi:hypothetical protein